MDLQVVIIGLIVFVVSAVVIYLISAFTMKEKTFEEVIAEQKRQQEAEDKKAKLEKKAEKDNRRKFKRKEKTKDKSPHGSPQPTSVSDSDTKEPKMVNLEIDPEIIEPFEPKPLKLKKKDKPSKSILHNKDEKTPLLPEEFVEELIHTGPPPKDDLELKHLQDTKKQKKEKAAKVATEASAPKLVVEEVMKQTVTAVHAAAPPPTMMNDDVYDRGDKEVTSAKLISSIKSAPLKDEEAQSIIEILLNKQGVSAAAFTSDWSKKSQKGDPVALLRKQLEEKERSLQEEQAMAMSANTKLKEVRLELNQEKVRHDSMEKSYKDKVDYQNQEVQALHSRIQQSHEQHMVDSTQMRARIQQLEGQAGDQSRVKRLAEENKMLRDTLTKTQAEAISPSEMNSLKQKVSIMEKELSSNVTKLNASDNMKKTLEQKVAKYENDFKNWESSQSAMVVLEKRVDEMGQELRKSEAKNASQGQEMQGAKKAVDTAHSEVIVLQGKLRELEQGLINSDKAAQYMEDRLKEADRHKIESEGNLKNLQKRLEDYNTEKNELSTEVKALRQEKSVLMDELRTTQERLQAESEAALSKVPAINGDVIPEAQEPQIPLSEHTALLSQKDVALNHLVTEVESRKSELSSLTNELDVQKRKNNELREKNWKAMDALDKSEKSVSAKLQSAITANRTNQTDLESQDKAVFQRLFPDITVEGGLAHKDWMSKFETNAANHLKSVKIVPDNSAKYEEKIQELQAEKKDLVKQLTESQSRVSDLDSKLSSAESRCCELEKHINAVEESRDSLKASVLETENSYTKLQSQVSQYRSVLAETENKLTQLENSVESEEKKWQERLQTKEGELEQASEIVVQLRAELIKSKGSVEMAEKVESLESQLNFSTNKCLELQSQVTEAELQATEYRSQVDEAQKSSAMVATLNSELEELRRMLSEEKKRNKDLAFQVVKLNGIIKTGHDALTQEQALVAKLKQVTEGSGQSSAVGNDNSSGSGHLRQELEESQRLLEKEISANKLLTQRLAGSQSSLNESGSQN